MAGFTVTQLEAIETAIASLPEQQQLALILRRYEDMAYEEIAAILETTVPSVKSLLFRAREDLRSKLARFLDDSF
jgi:RNA polymerase sigma-70 factor (ECF subfamily)